MGSICTLICIKANMLHYHVKHLKNIILEDEKAMKCPNCGCELKDEFAKFCLKCGTRLNTIELTPQEKLRRALAPSLKFSKSADSPPALVYDFDKYRINFEYDKAFYIIFFKRFYEEGCMNYNSFEDRITHQIKLQKETPFEIAVKQATEGLALEMEKFSKFVISVNDSIVAKLPEVLRRTFGDELTISEYSISSFLKDTYTEEKYPVGKSLISTMEKVEKLAEKYGKSDIDEIEHHQVFTGGGFGLWGGIKGAIKAETVNYGLDLISGVAKIVKGRADRKEIEKLIDEATMKLAKDLFKATLVTYRNYLEDIANFVVKNYMDKTDLFAPELSSMTLRDDVIDKRIEQAKEKGITRVQALVECFAETPYSLPIANKILREDPTLELAVKNYGDYIGYFSPFNQLIDKYNEHLEQYWYHGPNTLKYADLTRSSEDKDEINL